MLSKPSVAHDSQLADLNARMERLDIEKSKALAECENLKQRLKDAGARVDHCEICVFLLLQSIP